MASNRRLAGIVFAGEYLGDFLKNGSRVIRVESGVPDTARFYTAYFDNSRNAFIVVLEDESFDELAAGSVIPILPGAVLSVMSTDLTARTAAEGQN